MLSRTTRDRLALPVAAIVACGLVSALHTAGSVVTVPRLTEVSAVRLQAEVTSLVTGMVDADDAELRAAASTPTGTGTEADAKAAASCTYPCTIFDKFLSSLPEDVLYAILPPLYVFASVLGLVLAPVTLLTSAVFGWPFSLRPAAAVPPEIPPAPGGATSAESDPVEPNADPVVSSTAPVQTADAGETPIGTTSGSDDSRQLRGQRTAGRQAQPAEVVMAPDASAASVPSAADAVAVPTADVLNAPTTADEDVADAAPVERQVAGPRGRSAEAGPAADAGPSDSAAAPQRAAKRSAR